MSPSAALERLIRDLTRVDPDHPRGLIGCVDGAGAAQYGYPEIAGYWLRFAARLPTPPVAMAESLIDALAALNAEHGSLPTRLGWHAALPKAYAGPRYLFDLVMVYDGLRQWHARHQQPRTIALLNALRHAAEAFADGPTVHAAIGIDSGHWSATAGPFLLKVAARFGAEASPIARACRAAIPRWLKALATDEISSTHAALYAIEGALALGETALARAAFARLRAQFGGSLIWPESARGGPLRSDVLAQAVRVASALDAPPAAAIVALIERVDGAGRIAFAPAHPDHPTWAQLFAVDALMMASGAALEPAQWT
jgi:hypothetical protein